MRDLQTREQMLSELSNGNTIPEDVMKAAREAAAEAYPDARHSILAAMVDGLYMVPIIANAILAERERSRTALSEADQRAKDAESNLNEEISHRKKLQSALMFWMPSVTEEIERSTNGRCGDDACLLAGYDGPIDESCWGDEILARAQSARREALEEAAELVEQRLGGLTLDSFIFNDVRAKNDEGSTLFLSLERAQKVVEDRATAIRALIPSEPHDEEGRETTRRGDPTIFDDAEGRN